MEIKIERGSMTFLIGPSGSGKSTYLRLLNGTLLPDKGTVRYEEGRANYDILSYRKKYFVYPRNLLFEGTIKENFRRIVGSCVKSRLIWIRCGKPFGGPPLLPSETFDCRSLFLAERQRAYLALFLSFSPDVLLDEPTASLDEDTAQTCFIP